MKLYTGIVQKCQKMLRCLLSLCGNVWLTQNIQIIKFNKKKVSLNVVSNNVCECRWTDCL